MSIYQNRKDPSISFEEGQHMMNVNKDLNYLLPPPRKDKSMLSKTVRQPLNSTSAPTYA